MKQPVRVAITGAAGQIGYQLCFRIASGDMLGKDQPVIRTTSTETPGTWPSRCSTAWWPRTTR